MSDTQVVELKVKVVSLMDEARRIRKEERRALSTRKADKPRKDMGRGFLEYDPEYRVFVGRDQAQYVRLRGHRVNDIRPEARAALLAYAYLRGVPYRSVEAKCRKPVDLKRLRQLVVKFGGLPDQPLKLADGELEAWLALQPAGAKGTS